MNKVIYLDTAASALKPESVIRAEMDFLQNAYANAGRGICGRAAAVDDMIAAARADVARFINAAPDQIIFTSGTTDGMNRIVHIINDCVCGAGIKNKIWIITVRACHLNCYMILICAKLFCVQWMKNTIWCVQIYHARTFLL